jgi:hypothetical protein
MAIQTLYPSISPSLSLDFANVKALDPRITFTRTTTATYYNGVTTAKAEENLRIYSQEFDNPAWQKSAVTVTANATTAPDGTTTAEEVFETATTAEHRIANDPVITSLASTPYTLSVFAKKNTRDWLILNLIRTGVANFRVWFDLNTGVVGTTTAGITAAITSVGNGWYRCSVTRTTNSAETSTGIGIGIADADNSFSYAGDITKSIYIWGAQLEQRSAVTDYTPTTTQPITNYIPVLLTAASGVARFDHNPVTGESLGLLVEEQRSNLVTYSDDFADAAWTKTRASITSNTIVAPDGTLTGDKLVEDTTASNTHLVLQSVSGTTNTNPYTASVYVKAGERSSLNIQLQEGSPFTRTVIVVFDIASASVGTITESGGATGTSGTITAVGNGWYRCSVTTTLGGSTGSIRTILLLNNGTTSSYTGDGYSGLYIWGAQLEAGAFPTSYIPTVAATVTRNADAASMTGANFTSWFNNAEGTLYADASTPFEVPSNRFMQLMHINDGTTNNSIRIAYNAELTATYGVTVNATSQVDLNQAGLTGVRRRAIAFAYSTNNFAGTTNGITALTDTSGTVPVVSQMNIGTVAPPAAVTTLSGHIRKLAYYPIRATNAQLQALTS